MQKICGKNGTIVLHTLEIVGNNNLFMAVGNRTHRANTTNISRITGILYGVSFVNLFGAGVKL